MMRRKTFLAATATIAAVGTSACAKGEAGELELVEPASQFDYPAFKARVGRSADVRQLWDVGANPPAALSEIKNALNGYQFGFGIRPERIAMVACLHNVGNIAAYDDTAWQKYTFGEVFGVKDRSGNPISSNIFARARTAFNTGADPSDPSGMYQDPTLQALQHRGVVVLLCHTGAAEQARLLAQTGAAAGTSPQTILQDLLAHVVSGVIVVPSAVAVIGLLQNRFGYAYTAVSA